MHDYWLRQTADKPLFPDLLWSRPENRAFAGKLAIIGGNAQGFASPASAYGQALKAGIGTVRVLLPDSLAKTLGRSFDAGEFAPSTPSGSFAQKALAEWLDLAMWADGVLLDGDMGRNSETAIVIEKFLAKFQGAVTLCNDSVDYVTASPLASSVLSRPSTLLVTEFSQLQKLFIGAHSPRPVTSDMDLVRLMEVLHHASLQHQATIMTRFNGRTLVAVEGQVSDTPVNGKALGDDWTTTAASHAAVWWLQNPSKPFQAITTSLI